MDILLERRPFIFLNPFINMRIYSAICLVLGLAGKVASQADGNPHNWDRQRRCDHTDYDPPCGLCEGIGGIVWGDNNEDITITSCTPIAEPSEIDNAPKPLWTNSVSLNLVTVLTISEAVACCHTILIESSFLFIIIIRRAAAALTFLKLLLWCSGRLTPRSRC